MRAFFEDRDYNDELPVLISITKNKVYRAHWHNDVELIYVIDGQITVGVNSESRVLNSGDIAVASSNDIHYYSSEEQESTIIMVIFKPELIDFSLGWPENLQFKTSFLIKKENESHIIKIGELFKELAEEFKSKPPFFKTMIKGQLLMLCSLLQRILPIVAYNHEKAHGKVPSSKAIVEALKYIETNYAMNITLEKVSNLTGLSLNHFSKVFGDFTGTNFKTYLNTIRIENAEKKIIETNMPILDIAYECGFNSIRTFNRAFKEIRGVKPSDFRKVYRHQK